MANEEQLAILKEGVEVWKCETIVKKRSQSWKI
jgi:hypothetical protein